VGKTCRRMRSHGRVRLELEKCSPHGLRQVTSSELEITLCGEDYTIPWWIRGLRSDCQTLAERCRNPASPTAKHGWKVPWSHWQRDPRYFALARKLLLKYITAYLIRPRRTQQDEDNILAIRLITMAPSRTSAQCNRHDRFLLVRKASC